MTASKFCTQCGSSLEPNAHFCAHCSAKTESTAGDDKGNIPLAEIKSPKSAITALLLCLFLGTFGLHRFYVGKIGTGILMLLTGGGFGIWTLVDLIVIACCEFKDKEGKTLEFTKGKASRVKLVLIIIAGLLTAVFLYVAIFNVILFQMVFHATTDQPGDKSSNALSSNDIRLLNAYEDQHNKFSIKYPADWEIARVEKNAVIFGGKKGTPSYYSTVSIEFVPTKKAGGVYENIKDAANSIKKQRREHVADVKILDEGSIEVSQNAKKFHGEYFIASYTYNGKQYKKMQFIITKEGGSIMYSWVFTSPIQQYANDLSKAKAMYESWSIE